MHIRHHTPLTVCCSDAKAGDFLNRQQNCSEQQLGNRNFFRESGTYDQHLKHSDKELKPWKMLHPPSSVLQPASICLWGYSVLFHSALVSSGLKLHLPWERLDLFTTKNLNRMACFWRSGTPLPTDKKNYPEWFYTVFKRSIAVQFKCIIQKIQSFYTTKL